MSGLARKIFVGQLSATIASIPDSSSSLMDCVARIIAAWCLHHVVANGLVFYEEPRLIEQEELGGAEVLGVSDFIRRSVQNVKQQWFQDFRRIVPAVEIKC